MRGNLFGILLSALNMSAKFMVRSIIAKFFVFFALFFIVHGFTQVMMQYIIPASMGSENLDGLFGNVTEGMWYFLDVFAFPVGFSAILSAYVVRFIIRRLPVIG